MKHYFDIEVAKEVGINAAIIYENINYWVKHNKKQGRNERDGAFWTYGTQKDIAAQFEYLSIKQVRTALEKLEASGYIRTGSYNRHGYDRTTWYTTTEKGESKCPTGQMDEPIKSIGFDTVGATIPDNNKNIENKDNISQRAKDIALRCGINFSLAN